MVEIPAAKSAAQNVCRRHSGLGRACPMTELPDLAAVKEQSQKMLFELLEEGLDLGFTFLQIAATGATSDPAYAGRAVEKAQIALDSVRDFVERIEDTVRSVKIQARADQLAVA